MIFFKVTNQIRSINYQLSNLKYLQEGWTVRPVDTPLDFDDNETEEVELNSLARKSARGIKTRVFIFNLNDN